MLRMISWKFNLPTTIVKKQITTQEKQVINSLSLAAIILASNSVREIKACS